MLFNMFRLAVTGAISEVVVGAIQEAMPKNEDGSAKSALVDMALTLGGLILTGAIVSAILPKNENKKTE